MILKSLGVIGSRPGKGATLAFSILAVLCCCCEVVRPANILFYHHVASYSHRIASYPLASALADKGHHVTYITPFPIRDDGSVDAVNPKIREIVPKPLEQLMQSILASEVDVNLRVNKHMPNFIDIYFPIGLAACNALWSSNELKEFVNNTKTLDLIIMDYGGMGECISPLAHLYNSKLVAFGTVARMPHEYDQFGFGPESGSIPEVDHEVERVPMVGLVARLRNTLLSLQWRYEQHQYMNQLDGLVRRQQHIMLEELEGIMPHMDDVARNISLFLSTGGDPVTDYPRSQPPLVVDVAGMHCREGRPLPKELEDFIAKKGSDEADEGFIYISLGTAVVASDLQEGIKQVFFSTMEAFPKLKFLWKWDGEVPKGGYPKNLHLAKWYPQQDLLAHSKIKAFVTQNGRPSSLEAVYHAVPMISFPVVADQDFNANRLAELRANVILEFGTLSVEELKGAITLIAYDKRIKSRMVELQKIHRDQPMPPLEKAVWWVEFVLRHKNTTHLRSLGFTQWWYQRRLLDVWGLFFLAIYISMLLLLKMLDKFANFARNFVKDAKK